MKRAILNKVALFDSSVMLYGRVDAIRRLPLCQRAADLGAAIRAEDGVGNAVKVIESLL